MRSLITGLTVAALLCAASAAPTDAQDQPSTPNSGAAAPGRLAGTWDGSLGAGGMKLRLELVVRDSAGGLTGSMRSIDQGNAVAHANLAATGDSLTVDVPEWHIGFGGVLTPSRDSLRGTFRQGATSMPLTFGRASTPVTAERPQDPKPPFPYAATDVTFESVPGVRLAGTVIIPQGRGPFPAVVLVTGSGPQDRNEALMGHRPFLVIADYLARHGIASLRYDDRGVAHSTGSFGKSTSEDFAKDAEAAVHYAMRVKGIASNHVGILGHSEGGLIGPMVAAQSRDVAFLVLMSGPGVPGDSILLLQGRLIAIAMGAPPGAAAAATASRRLLIEAVAQAHDSLDAVARLAKAKDSILAAVPNDRRSAAETQLDQATAELVSPWFRYFVRYDPRPALRHVHVPVLALGGSLDLQVPAREDLAAIDTALRAGGNRDYRVEELPKLNHLFQTATTGAPSEYGTIEETVAPAALDSIATWINAHFRVP